MIGGRAMRAPTVFDQTLNSKEEITMIRIAIAGYGNLGRGTELAVAKNPDMKLVAVFPAAILRRFSCLTRPFLCTDWTMRQHIRTRSTF